MSLSFLDVKRADKNYEFFYGDLYSLMFKAGSMVAETVETQYGKGRRILVACGSGNNGGDGFVAARILSASNDVTVLAVSGREGMKTEESRKAAREYKGKIVTAKEVARAATSAEIIVDALLGVGIVGEPREPYSSLIKAINSSGKNLVSVDIPSGLGSRTRVKPNITVTFTGVKQGMTKGNSGNIVEAGIGIPEKVFTHNGPGEFAYYRLPGKDSHKGMNGSVALVAGWTFYGSAIIASMGAIRAGSDLVRIYSRHENRVVLSSYSPDIIVRDAENREILEEIRNSDAILIGPGLGKSQPMDETLRAIKGFKGTIVLDAEGLDLVSKVRKVCPETGMILTPHRGEFQRISGKEPDERNAAEFAKKLNCSVILKGVLDTVTDGKRTRYTEGGNPRMSMGGTGDLLAGIASAISTRVEDPFNAACLASFINKRVGDMCFRQKSYWYTIEDMIGAIPDVMKMSEGTAILV